MKRDSLFLVSVAVLGCGRLAVAEFGDGAGLGQYVAAGLGSASATSSNQDPTITPGPTLKVANQANLTKPDSDCQDSWNSYWSSLEAFQMGGVSGSNTFTFNISTPSREVVYAETTSQEVHEEYFTSYILNPSQSSVYSSLESIPSEWRSTLSYSVSTYTYSVYPLTTFTSNVEIPTITTAYATAPAPSPTQPTCSPPINSADCASSWSDYSSSLGEMTWWLSRDYFTPTRPILTTTPAPPACYNPPINTSSCSTLRNDFNQVLANQLENIAYNPGVSLAPGCTLGCGKCSLAASSFQILYWGTQSSNITATTPVTAVVDDMTLTSPQVYLSFTKLWATDSCSDIGTTIQSGIVPIETDGLSRVGVINGLPLSGTGQLNPTGGGHYIYTTAFPFSQFLQWQASNTTAFHLSLPPELRTLESEWNDCDQITIGIPEPPSVLTPATMITPISPQITPVAAPAPGITTSVTSTSKSLSSTPASTFRSSASTESIVPVASAITEKSEKGGLMGPSLTQTTQAQQSSDTQTGNGGNSGNAESSTAMTLQAQQPADTPSGNGDNTENTAPPPSGTAMLISQTSQLSVSESAIQSTSGTKISGSDGNILLTIGSTTVTAKQTVLPASGSVSVSEPALVLGSSTLTAGGSPIVVQDQTVSLVSLSQAQSQSSLPASQNTPAGLGIVVGGTTTLNAIAVSGSQVSGAEASSTGEGLSGSAAASSSESSRASSTKQQTSGSASSTTKGSSVSGASSSLTIGAAATTIQSASEGNIVAVKHLCWVVFFVAALGALL